jgi:hypothetical protein
MKLDAVCGITHDYRSPFDPSTMRSNPRITVEFYGIPRQRAVSAEVSVRGATIADILAALERECPGLGGLRRADGGLAEQYLLSLDGGRFLADPHERLGLGEGVQPAGLSPRGLGGMRGGKDATSPT